LTATDRSNWRVVHCAVASATVSLAAADILEVTRPPKMTRIPLGPVALSGLAKLRGVATPVFDLAELLGKSQDGDKAWLVLLNTTPAYGLLVDRITSMSDEKQIQPGTLHIADGDSIRSLELSELFVGQSVSAGPLAIPELPDLPRTAAADEAMISLLAFTVAGQQYALKLSEIVEVVALPRDIEGQTTLTVRDTEVQLVSLSTLLGLEDAVGSGWKRLIVINVDGQRMGLVVDGARSILRAPETKIGAAPFLLNRESDAARIHSVLRLPDGRGVVSVLTIDSLFRPEAIHSQATTEVAGASTVSDNTSQFVIFRIGEDRYGYPLDAITEIGRRPEKITPVPGAPAYIVGVINLRGNVVPVVDQGQRFGVSNAAHGSSRIIFSDIQGVPCGFLVDSVERIRRVAVHEIDAAPELTGSSRGFFDRVIVGDEGEQMILVVDPKGLLDPVELQGLAAVSGSATL
jgi:purine-binding chemotaxis protein CheW